MPNIELCFNFGLGLNIDGCYSQYTLTQKIWAGIREISEQLVSDTVLTSYPVCCVNVKGKEQSFIRLYYDGADDAKEIMQLKEFLRTLADVEVIQLEEFLAKSK